MRHLWGLSLTIVLVIGFVGVSNAHLTTIGTANYQGQDYKLIYMDEGPLGPVTWLDYTAIYQDWHKQVNWVSGLGGELTVTLDAGYTSNIDWGNGWRLPSAGDNPKGGYNVNTSEMGYLYYEELGNIAYDDPGWGLQNSGDFDNLLANDYFSGTDWASDPDEVAWSFVFYYGLQGICYKDWDDYALAVRPGEVNVVPIPGAVWLLGAGLISLAGLRNKRKD